MKEVFREINNAFNGFINNNKVGATDLHFNLKNDTLNLTDKHIEKLNELKEKIKYEIDLAVGDKLK